MLRTVIASALLLLGTLFLIPMQAADAATTEFFVAANGNDTNPGTEDRPLATIGRAQELVRQTIAAGPSGDIRVTLRSGVYRLRQPLVFGTPDSGSTEHSVTYAGFPGGTAVLSGGQVVTGWEKSERGIWTAKLDMAAWPKQGFRDLFVNGRRAVRARTPNQDAENPSWQLVNAELASDLSRYTLTLPPDLLGDWSNPADIEVMVSGNWEINRLPVKSIDRGAGTVVLAPPHAQGHEAIRPGPGRWCHFENALEMLDQPGEWYLDRVQGLLHYWPVDGEDMTKAEVVAPRLERLIEVRGKVEHPVRNLHLRGLHLEHVGWTLPPGGYLGIQACHFTAGKQWTGDWARVPAAIRWDYAEQCSLQDCVLAHLGGCGVELVSGCNDNVVGGNEIFDVSGNGIVLGGPRSEAEVPKRVRICNNHVHDCGVEFYGAVGIWVGFAQQAALSHNLVHGLPYSGISVGWQWNPEPTPCKENLVEYNHVYDVMNRLCDGGCIYTLGFQPGTTIRGNHLHAVHRSRYAQGAPNNGMFIDEGSKGFHFEQNVIYDTAAELVRFNQCQRDWHTWKDNHFGAEAEVLQAGRETVAKAGLEPAYRDRRSH